MTTKKKFDAVSMVRQIRDAHYEQTKGMKREERLAYYLDAGQAAQKELERLAVSIKAST